MPWPRPTLPELDTRVEGDMTSRLTGNAPLMRKAVLKIVGKALAALAHILHGFLSFIALNVMADLAEEAWLERITRTRGLQPPRLPSAPAVGSLTILGTDATVIPEGEPFLSDAGLEYRTDAAVTIGAVTPGTATASATCTTSGADGNIPAGAVLTSATGLNVTVTAAATFTGGADKEGVEALRERLINFIQEPPAGGSKADYVKWARSIPGVRNAWPFPNHYGRGTVAVVVSATGEEPVPSTELVDQVQAYIDQEDVRPITANVTVEPIVAATVELTISMRPNTAALRDAIRANLAAMFAADARPNGTLYLSHLQKAINLAGLEDVEIDSIEVDNVSIPLANHVFTGFKYMVLDPLVDGDFGDL